MGTWQGYVVEQYQRASCRTKAKGLVGVGPLTKQRLIVLEVNHIVTDVKDRHGHVHTTHTHQSGGPNAVRPHLKQTI